MTERRQRVRKSKKTEPSLFDENREVASETAQLVLTSNFTIGPLLARGCLLSAGDDLEDPFPHSPLQYSAAPLPTSWVEAVVASARNVIPIAIQLRPGRNLRRIKVPNVPQPVEAVCLTDVAALLFRDQKELSRFSSIEFDNYSIDAARIPLQVDPGAFTGPSSRGMQVASETPPPDASADQDRAGRLKAAIRQADSLLGLITCLLSSSPGRHSWMRGVQGLTQRRPAWSADASWPERLAAVVTGTLGSPHDVERALLVATVHTIADVPVEAGWPAESVLSEIRQAALSLVDTANSAAKRDIELWADRARDVLSAKSEPTSMNDDAHVVQRATLLLLLRGDFEGIATGNRASVGRLRPGPHVAGLASALAALRSGARALPAASKSGPQGEASGRLLAYMGELFAALLAEGSGALFPRRVPKPVVTYRRIGTLQGEWVTSVNDREITRIPASFDTGLERLLTMGRHLGFDFLEHGDNGLETNVAQSDGKQRPVYVKVLNTGTSSSAIVRFSSPTLKLEGVKAKSRLPKDFLLNLLIRNSDPEMNCRFAIDEDEGLVVVLVDQLLGTLDEAEFRQHVQHVAEVADKFELSRAVKAEVS